MRWRVAVLALAVVGAACSGGSSAARPQPSTHSPAPSQRPPAAAAPSPPAATPAYWIESLRARSYPGGPMAAHGFISVAPNWPGYAGSGPGQADVPPIVAQTIATLDLVGSLGSLPRADTGRVALVGHSNGGGISEIAMVVDPRIRAVV